MTYALTVFHNRFDNKTEKRMSFETWEEFISLLEGLSKKQLASKNDAQLISPATYITDTTRANRNVEKWSKWAAVDVDEYRGTVEDLIKQFAGSSYVIYSTASSTNKQPKFRIVFELDQEVEKDQIKHFWYALNTALGDLGDAQTKDSSRMYYIPATYLGANNFFYRGEGKPLPVKKLMLEHPYTEKTGNSFLDNLPDEMRKQVLEHRKTTMDNTNVTWTGYLDCPFVPNRMVAEYKSINETGWYRQMFRIMVATASNAIRAKYPISASEISILMKQIDAETGGWYDNRPLEREAAGAIEFAYANTYEG